MPETITRVDAGLRRGEGWVERRERSDGSVVFVSRWYDGSGKDRKLQYHAHPHPEGGDEQDTIDTAADHNRKVARQKRRGTYRPPEKRLVKDVVNAYIDRSKARWSANTTYTHRLRAEKMIRPYIGDMLLTSLTSDVLQHWVDRLGVDKYKPRPIHAAVAVLSGALKSARRLKLITDNPLEGVELPPIAQAEHATWSLQEIAQVLAYVADSPRYSALYRVALITGARPGELLVLRWANVDLVDGSIRIARTRTRTESGKWIEGDTTKTKTERRVPIDEIGVAALQVLAASREEGEDYVFFGRRGPLSINTWRTYHDQMIETLGITKITLHELRHTNATIEISAGTNWLVVKDRLGHKKVQTTLDVYAHLAPAQHKEAAEALGKRLLQFPGTVPDTTTSAQKQPKTG